MIQSPFGKISRQTKRVEDLLRWKLWGSELESVYFYTLHKCASSLFAGYVLPNALGLRHIHFARQIYRQRSSVALRFEKSGHIYGPIRVSADRQSPVYQRLVRETATTEFVKDKSAVFLVRDPRDILVSAYYSFGFHHSLSRKRELRKHQLSVRTQLQATCIDEFVLARAEFFRDNFQLISKLHNACRRSVILKYEDMVAEFDSFTSQLGKKVELKPAVVKHLRKVSRPRQSELETHRRSGRTEAFRSKLKPNTISRLNFVLANVLNELGYSRSNAENMAA